MPIKSRYRGRSGENTNKAKWKGTLSIELSVYRKTHYCTTPAYAVVGVGRVCVVLSPCFVPPLHMRALRHVLSDESAHAVSYILCTTVKLDLLSLTSNHTR